MDLIDRKILFELQRDASQSIALLAERVGLSSTPCWKRVQKLEQSGVIQSRVALVDPEKIGLTTTVFVDVTTADHSVGWRSSFAEAIRGMPEVMDMYRMAGEVDYVLRVVVSDLPAFDRFYKRLTERVLLKNITSHVAMERVKSSTAFQINTSDR